MAVEKQSSELNNLNTSAAAQDGTTPAHEKEKEASCCTSLKIFLVALSFSYFAKAYSGSYMKSSLTQIERRFDISTSTAGMVDASFEFGNLLVIAFVSYFGATLHRPRIIAAGCFLMALGSFLTVMPHFFMGPYEYEAMKAQVTPPSDTTGSAHSVSPCLPNRTMTEGIPAGCAQESGSYMWVYVLVGNILRGIGETPITPLGIAYIDDFAGSQNTPLYLACLHTVAMFGPMAAFMLSSLFAKLYVDIGFVNLDTVSITPQDTRWVGAWWLGFLVAGTLSLIAGIPFCFLPKTIKTKETPPSSEGQKPKEAEHHKKATLKGATTLPAATLGMFVGGLLMKKYRFGLLKASKFLFTSTLVAFILSLSVFMLGCENREVAGITVSYNGSKLDTLGDNGLYPTCNGDCRCSTQQWDPVCGVNNITYMSPCLAGCKSSTGSGKNIVYQDCSCIESMGLWSVNSSATLGSCPRSDACARMLLIYVISQIFTTFIFALGGSASYMIVLWCVPPELKSLAVGVYLLVIRVLAGIPAPIYFGALIDRTCLKWGTKPCGGRGACRLYDTHSFRSTFLGLAAGIRMLSFILFICFIFMVKKKSPEKKQENDAEKPAHPENGGKGGHDGSEIEKQTFI
ncbi:solute carrier organic anion transporter family member 1C1-like isoform X2 [Eleutherodactylus coqui]|uniref:solute carrier organic anion transporter family member 1C1-like isoform X2 n=1 Tax=Eleutherodactylus coqui TaxID=57060 RepID=UPI003462AF57